MSPENKGILINAIVSYLSGENKKKNKELAKQNMHSEQTAFDAGTCFLDLAFMPDDELDKIAKLVLK